MPKDSKPPFVPFYVDDFASDGKVEAMSTEEVGAYILLLCKAWREEPVGSLPADDRVLARWSRLTSERWSECKLAVLAPFELRQDGRLYQKRMEREFRKFKETKKKREKAATIAATTRWDDAKRMRNASKSQCVEDANSCHSSSSSESYSESEGKPKPKSSSEPPKAADSKLAVLVFPCNQGRTWGLPQSLVDVLVQAYPAIDVLAECRKALAWLHANQANQKTPGGMSKFLNSWMERNQNRAPPVKGSPVVSAKPTMAESIEARKRLVLGEGGE